MNKKVLFIIILIFILFIGYNKFFKKENEFLNETNYEELKINNKSKMNIEKLENRDEIIGTSMIRNFDNGNLSTNEMMLNIGRVFNCLGEPNYTSINSENWFEYDLKCDGIILTIYGSSLEIDIGGMQDEQSRMKANELVEYIKSFEPKDIYYEAYYMDLQSKEIFEIKNGKPLYRYEDLNLNNDEFKKLYEKVYNLE